MWQPSKRFRTIHGEGVTRAQADRTLSSILYNHDTVPDLVTMTCELAVSKRRAMTFGQAADLFAAAGASFDADGWYQSS
jgi:hypothetical protein